MDINGTPQPDFLDDTPGDDVIDGGAGDDSIATSNGHDRVDGGPGADVLNVRWGAETSAIVNASAIPGYEFRLVGGPGRSIDLRGIESLTVTGGSGDDNFVAPGTNDTLYDADPFSGLPSGNDTLGGGGGDDSILIRDGQDAVDGGDGDDILFISWEGAGAAMTSAAAPAGFDARFVSGAGRSVNLVGVERLGISGTSFGDTITGLAGNDTIDDAFGNAFDNDVLNGAGGDDLIFVRSGHDVVEGGAGTDRGWVDWRAATAPITMAPAPAGYDIRFVSADNRSVNLTGIEGYVISSGSGDDVVITQGGNDIFFDHSTAVDSDSFEGGAGEDHHYVKMGMDRGDGGTGYDGAHLQWRDATAPVLTTTAAAGYEIRFETGANRRVDWKGFESFSIETGTGNDNVTLIGGDDFLFDAGGDDRFDGGAGDDFISAGLGNDEALGGAGSDDVAGGDGNDILRGGDGNDFLYAGAGTDQMFGDDGDDAGFLDDDSDSFTGGAGTDTAIIVGNHASFTAHISPDTEVLLLGSGTDTRFGAGDTLYDYDIVIPNGAADSNAILTVQATGLVAGEDLKFDGSAQQNGAFRIFAGRGVDQLIGGAGNDGFFFDADAAGSLTGADRVDGGTGTDTLALRGDYTGAKAVVFEETSLANVEVLTFLTGHANPYGGPIVPAGFDYAVTMASENVAAGARMDVIATTLGADESTAFDGRAESDGSFRILLGAGDDSAYGGQGGDILYGGLGADQLDGSAGADRYVYRAAAESTAAATDRLTLGEGDRIDLAAIDANGNAADGNQAFAYIGVSAFTNTPGQLRAYQANGTWTIEGDVDGNGIADLVVSVTTNLTITADSFIL